MSQPEGFVVKGHEHKVCKLVKSFYGLKQASRAWYEKLTEHLLKLNFKHYDLDDATLFVKKVSKTIVYLVVYVDDILMRGNKESYIASIKKKLGKSFEMINLGYVHYYLGYVVSLGSGAVSWRSRKQSIPTDSTTEAEYVAVAEATKEIVWLRKILEYLEVKQVQSTPLMIDTTFAIKLAKNPKFHDRMKHINTKYHLIRHHVEAKTIHLRHCSTSEQIPDIFTKALGREKLE
eukprot:PITA_27343